MLGIGGVYNSINLNLYAYTHQNPVKYTDPDGRAVPAAIIAACAASVGCVSLVAATATAIGIGVKGTNDAITNSGSNASSRSQATAIPQARTSEDNNGRYVYRALREGENPAKGLFSKDPTSPVSPELHVRNGSRLSSSWISTTKNPAVALGKYNRGHGVVRIDLDKVTSPVLDVSSGIFPGENNLQPSSGNFARADQEVLIQYYVPPNAIEKIQ